MVAMFQFSNFIDGALENFTNSSLFRLHLVAQLML